MKKYSVLIVGAGNQGALSDIPGSENSHKIISFAHAFTMYPNFDIIGIADIDEEKSKHAEKIWNIPGGCSYIKPDVVVIATPDDAHFQELYNWAHKDVKLVIVEKPLCDDLQQAREIVELYKAKGIPLMVDNTRNFIPCLRNLTKEHGKAISGYCLFNRGWLHSAVHAIGFFRMFNLANYKIKEVKNLDFRVWILNICFEDGYVWSEERITNDMPVPQYYDFHMEHVVENAFNFLEGEEPLIYTGEMALKDLETCFNLM